MAYHDRLNYRNAQYIPNSSKFTGVAKVVNRHNPAQHKWQAHFQLPGKAIQTSKWFDDERQAAIAVDKFRLNHGLEPINILKRVEK